MDQEILRQTLHFVGVALQQLQIRVRILRFDRRHRHPAFDPPLQRPRLIEREVVLGARLQKLDDLRQAPARRFLRFLRLCRRVHRTFGTAPLGDRCRHVGDRQHQIDAARHRRARHAVMARFVRVLRDDEASLCPDGLEAFASVCPAARQDHADRGGAIGLRQRVQEKVERQTGTVRRRRLRKDDEPIAQRQIDTRRNDVDVVRLHPHAVRRLPHGHRRVPRKQFDHHAAMRGIEMLDEDEAHAAVGRHDVEELLKGVETSRGGPDGNYRKGPRPRRHRNTRRTCPSLSHSDISTTRPSQTPTAPAYSNAAVLCGLYLNF